MKKLSLLIAFLLLGGIAAYAVLQEDEPDIVFDSPPTPKNSSSEASSVSSQSDAMPRSVSINVPFASQAPLINWDMPYQEACEEASLILVHHYLSGDPLTLEKMDQSILDLVEYEKSQKLPADVTIEQLAKVAQTKYGYRTTIIEYPSIDDIKRELSAGNPVIVPLAGRDLGNPYYSGEGPWYHMLVIIGYDSRHFITNDVGTKRGAGYKYTYDTLMNSIHNWTGMKEEIQSGLPVALVILP